MFCELLKRERPQIVGVEAPGGGFLQMATEIERARTRHIDARIRGVVVDHALDDAPDVGHELRFFDDDVGKLLREGEI